MTDILYLQTLFAKHNIFYHVTELYNDTNNLCGYAIWLDQGHIEFDLNGALTNIVKY